MRITNVVYIIHYAHLIRHINSLLWEKEGCKSMFRM